MKTYLLGILLLFLSYLSLSLGSQWIGPSELFPILFSSESSELLRSIVFDIRLPRLMSCVLIGASLSLCGLYFQNILRNPLAEPFTMGFSGAASLGVSLGILFGLDGSLLGPSALGLLSCLLIAAGSLKLKNKIFLQRHSSLILIGISISFFCSALVVILQSLLSPTELQSSYQWLVGSFDSFRVTSWPIMLLGFAGLCLFQFFYHQDLDKVLLGKSSAESLGVNTKKIENVLYFLTALVCGLSVYIAGIIAFVGLVSPQLVKFVYGKNLHRSLFLPNILMGAGLLVFSDNIAVSLSNEAVIPTGGVVSLIGAPFLIYLIGRGRVNG